MGLFSTDNAFGRFMDRLGKWTALNFLYLLCCLPIITIGPAAAALYAVSLKMARGENVPIAKSYFAAFKQNFKKALAVNIIMLLIALALILSFYYMGQLQAEYAFYKYFKWVMYGVVLVYVVTHIYVYPLLAAFENTVRRTLTNALLLSITHIGATLIMLAISVGPLILCYFIPPAAAYGLFFYLLCGFSVTAFMHSKFFVNIFVQYSQMDDDEV